MTRKNSQHSTEETITDNGNGEWSPESEIAMQSAVDYINSDKPIQTEEESVNYTHGTEPEVQTEPAAQSAEEEAALLKAISERLNKQFNHVLALVSRCPGQQYEPGQFGECEFTLEQVIAVCYRIDFDETDAAIAKRMGRLVKKGLYTKVKRGIYKASPLLTMPLDDFMKTLDERAANRPIKRLN